MNAIDNAINAKMYRYSFLTSMELLKKYKQLVLNSNRYNLDEVDAVERLIYDRMKGEYEDDYDKLAKED